MYVPSEVASSDSMSLTVRAQAARTSAPAAGARAARKNSAAASISKPRMPRARHLET